VVESATGSTVYRMWYTVVLGDEPSNPIFGPEKNRGHFLSDWRGREPVRDWLKSLSPIDRKQIGVDIKAVEFGWPIGMPVCRPLGDGLYEVRSSLSQNRIARVLFYVEVKGKMVLLHGFIKKTQKTPPSDLELARKNKALHENELKREK
jgi:phage-related protein